LADLLHLFRTPSPEQEHLLAELLRLTADVSMACTDLAERYRERGVFRLLAAGGPALRADLETLHAYYERLAIDPWELLSRGDEAANTLALLLVDTRFNARLGVLSGFEFELRETRTGLAVLRAAADSFVVLSESEAQTIAGRVDFAAARLRALRDDLSVLRPQESDANSLATLQRAAERLLADARPDSRLDAKRGIEQAQARVAERLKELKATEARMAAELFSFRIWPALEGRFAARGAQLELAARRRQEAQRYLPGKRGSSNADPALARMDTDDRMRSALARALEGLSHDPLDEELSWIAAEASDFAQGELASRPLFDRFLVLRGIRHFDHRTMQGRQLNEREREALDKVQGLRGVPKSP
jgi:hypothetical protein